VNADDIAKDLIKKGCVFSKYQINFNKSEFYRIVSESELINSEFDSDRFKACIEIENDKLIIRKEVAARKQDNPFERIAQIIADYLRKQLLSEEKKFSFETVFSHHGKVDFIKQAKEAGYKVYLYFVSTEHPQINVYRVKVVRVGENGHDVQKEKIVSRYYRSMELLYEAAQHCYQAYFFDNSVDGNEQTLFAHFKLNAQGEKVWGKLDDGPFPNGFKKYIQRKFLFNHKERSSSRLVSALPLIN
jgi:predicted ABC-type ATPase